jgi:hypothetical protein
MDLEEEDEEEEEVMVQRTRVPRISEVAQSRPLMDGWWASLGVLVLRDGCAWF